MKFFVVLVFIVATVFGESTDPATDTEGGPYGDQVTPQTTPNSEINKTPEEDVSDTPNIVNVSTPPTPVPEDRPYGDQITPQTIPNSQINEILEEDVSDAANIVNVSGPPTPVPEGGPYGNQVTPQMTPSSKSNETLQKGVSGRRNTVNVYSLPTGVLEDSAYGSPVAIVRTRAGHERVRGSGVLIANNFVITAAHVMSGYGSNGSIFKVRIGDRDRPAAVGPKPYVDFSIRKVVIHPKYSRTMRSHDIALIHLEGIVPFPKTLRLASLPTATLATGTRCWVNGENRKSARRAGKYSRLNKINVPIVDEDKCSALLANVSSLELAILIESASYICAGGQPGTNVCPGKGGAPLVCESANHEYQVFGLVARDTGCRFRGRPDVYVNVLNYVPWITEQMTALPVSRNLPPRRNTNKTSSGTPNSNSSYRRLTNTPGFGVSRSHVTLLTMNNKIIGGGVLIAKDFVLTAANRIIGYYPGNLQLRLTGLTGRRHISLERFPASVVIHPDYKPGSLSNDIAVIRLNQEAPIIGTPDELMAKLPTKKVATGTRCWLSGWGKYSFGADGDSEALLRKVDLPIVDQDNCQTSLRTTPLGSHFILDKNSFICAGGELGKDACYGDGGAPLICESANQQNQVIGLVAWGMHCGTSEIPGVYVNVANYVPWIKKQMAAMR